MRRIIATTALWAIAVGAALAQPAPSPATAAANAAAAEALPPEDGEDQAFATRGFVATWDEPTLRGVNGQLVWDFGAYTGLSGPAPASVHPSLWRHAQLLSRHGLFQLHERIYQVRGFDVSNLTVILGDTGYIVVDPLTTVETASAAMTLVRRHLGERPVVAVIYSHSHADHFGGVAGVTTAAAVASGQVAVIAPQHFLEHAVGENVIAGAAMSRRAGFQFGAGLPPGPLGTMTSGIGPAIPQGTLSLIPPTREIRTTGEVMDIDGVRLEFQMTPGTEAPAEMNFYLPQFRALFMAENANASLHNILTPRGALVRDAKIWADGLTQSLRLYGTRSDILFTGHAWPRFGQDRIAAYLADHRDAYKYLHDQSVRLMNEGLTGPEIAEQIALPTALAQRWYNRGYYGTLRHNSRAVYQRYMGWYDGNPARLNPLPPEAAATRYVAAMGGVRRVKTLARQAIAAGDYRWAAELLDRLVFAAPQDAQARQMLADVHRQLAFQSESAIWRNMYLRAAAELSPDFNPPQTAQTNSIDLIRATPTPMLFDLLAVQVDPDRAAGPPVTLAFVFPERGERVLATLRNGVLVHEHGVSDRADVTVTLPRAAFLMGLFAGGGLPPGAAQVEGDTAVLRRFMAAFKPPTPGFAIVTP